jgi:signal transduction histidine kinase
MRTVELLEKIRPIWIERVSRQLARGESVRESFVTQLAEYIDMMGQAIITGDPSWMDRVLDDWAEARTETELENQDVSLAPLLSQIMMITHELASEILDDGDAMALLGAILPLYTYTVQYTTRLETKLYVEHISEELEDARLTLERLDKSKSDFIAVAAHELKTPLTIIEGYTAMLRDMFPEDDQESPMVLLMKGVDNGTGRLREIIDDMIDVSLLDNNMLKMNFQPVWVSQLINIVQRELESPLQDRRQHLEIVRFPGIDEMTFGDSERLYQALRNILTNAIKYTPDGGTITIDGRILSGFIEITISDTGIGIDVKDQERIFEKFGQVGNVALHSSGKIKFKGGGPGLGLPITKGIIEAHGGAIWVESEGYNEIKCPGTTFHVLLPIRKESPDQRAAEIFKPLADAGLNPPIIDALNEKQTMIRKYRRESW